MRLLDPIRRRAGLLQRLAAVLAMSGGVACSPEIGDACVVSTDCSSTGDRLCDTTQPNGYCTVFNCEPGSCPDDEAICVGFKSSTASTCQDPQQHSRFQRLFCMATCQNDTDCRRGYRCIDLSEPDNDHNAVIIETKKVKGKVCAVPASSDEANESLETGVCEGNDEPIDDSDKWEPVEDDG